MKFKTLTRPQIPQKLSMGLPFGAFGTFGVGCVNNFVCQVFVNRLLITRLVFIIGRFAARHALPCCIKLLNSKRGRGAGVALHGTEAS